MSTGQPPLRSYRALNRDGSNNIDRSNLSRGSSDHYHLILSMSWRKFLGFSVLIYVSVNLLFALAYSCLDSASLSGLEKLSGADFIWGCFFFSVQTFSTIGYGTVSPHSFMANVLVSIEAFVGMLSIAILSGLFFSRFSRPSAKVRFSEQALVTQYLGKRCLVFRLANARLNQIIEAEITVVVLQKSVTPEGISMRRQFDLKLLRSRSQFFTASWLVAHEIDSASPLFGLSEEDFKTSDLEILVSLMGWDEVFSQTIHARFSYKADEIFWGGQFADIVTFKKDLIQVDIDRISQLVEPKAHV